MMNKKIPLIISLLLLISVSCKDKPETPVETNKIEIGLTLINSFAQREAQVTTNITSLGGNQVLQHGHCWSLNQNPTVSDFISSRGILSQASSFTSTLNELLPGQKYYLRAYLQYQNGVVYGTELSFETINTGKPLVSTKDITEISLYSANSGGEVIQDSGLAVTQRGIIWSTDAEPTIEQNDGVSNDGDGIGSFICTMTDLQFGTDYYVRAYAINEKGIGYGQVKNFTTSIINIPVISTSEVSNITHTTAESGGSITSDGNGTITAKGIVWSTNSEPSLENNEGSTNDGTGVGSFASELTNLTEGTSYYVKAYATNEKGTGYGIQKQMTTENNIGASTFFDTRDGQTYNIVEIGDQIWFAENLNYETANSWWYNNSAANGEVYGRLYNWADAPNVCPSGWHLSTDEDWLTLEMFIGMSQSEANLDSEWRGVNEGKKLKSTSEWSNNGNGTDDYGFKLLPGGYRTNNGGFSSLKSNANLWFVHDSNRDGYRGFSSNSLTIYRATNYWNTAGLSIRCVKD